MADRVPLDLTKVELATRNHLLRVMEGRVEELRDSLEVAAGRGDTAKCNSIHGAIAEVRKWIHDLDPPSMDMGSRFDPHDPENPPRTGDYVY